MLHLIPSPLHRVGLRLAHALRKRWWRLRKPVLLGCRVLAFDGGGRVLLVRHSYGSGRWMLPGGGLGRGEDMLDAARRELWEEVGCVLHDARLIERIDEPLSGATNRVHIVAGSIGDEPRGDGREVIEARLFPCEALPQGMSPMVEAGLTGWVRAAATAPAQRG